MKNKFSLTLLLTITMTMCFGMTVFASPKAMPDGTIFDAEFYAGTNLDVMASIGTDENALYQHYITTGKAEGRKPFFEPQSVEILAATGGMSQERWNRMIPVAQLVIDGSSYPLIDQPSDLLFYTPDDGLMEESVTSYIEPLFQLCAQNGYKYLIKDEDVNSDSYLKDVSFHHNYYLANVPNPSDESRVIKLEFDQVLQDYTTPDFHTMIYLSDGTTVPDIIRGYNISKGETKIAIVNAPSWIARNISLIRVIE